MESAGKRKDPPKKRVKTDGKPADKEATTDDMAPIQNAPKPKRGRVVQDGEVSGPSSYKPPKKADKPDLSVQVANADSDLEDGIQNLVARSVRVKNPEDKPEVKAKKGKKKDQKRKVISTKAKGADLTRVG